MRYEYECSECGKRFEVEQKISDEPLYTHNQIVHSSEEDSKCNGSVRRIITGGCGFIVKGGTQRFSGKTGRSLKKIDKAMAIAGIEDASGGWTKAEDKSLQQSKKIKRGKKKYLGKLMVD